MTADQPANRLCLNLAEHGEFLGDVLHRAVVLADLYAQCGVVDRRGVAVVRERLSERLGALIKRQRGDPLGVPGFPFSHPAAGKVLDGGVAGRLAQVAKRVNGKIVVRRGTGRMTGVGEAEPSRRPAAAARTMRPLFARHDRAIDECRIEVATDGRGGQTELTSELGDRGRPVLEERAGDAITSAAVVDRLVERTSCFHNAIIA